MLFCWAYASQDTVRLYADTLQASDLLHKADDGYLLSLLDKQREAINRRDDSLHQVRLKTDTTTFFPLHLGYADSLRIAEQVRRQGGMTPLCLPQLYRQTDTLHLAPLRYDAPNAFKPSEPLGLFQPLKPFEISLLRRGARRYLTTHAADLYVGMAKSGLFEEQDMTTNKSVYELSVPEKSFIKDAEEERMERLNRLKNQRNPWFKEAILMLQFTQNYVSGNWYEGGNSALSMYASAKGTIKYDDKKRISWENTLEWNEGFATTSGDTIHKINTSEDLFRLYSKLGVKVSNKLYGSFSVEYRSQVMPTYKANTMDLKTGFCTPIRFDLALGLDYKPVKGLSLVGAPAAYKMVYSKDSLAAKSFGISEGEHIKHQFGASVRLEWVWKPLREISLETKFYAYKSYIDKHGEIDLEVNCDFIINRFMSARVKLHPRYDSTRIMDGESKAKMQFKELISIGFSHKFH